MAPLCEGICRRRRLRGVSKGNTQKNHETRESILRTDFAGLGERDGKSAENGLQNRFSSTKNSLQHAVRKCENQKSYPHSCAQMWVNSADNSWITHYFVVENSCITATSMWKTQIRRTGCGKLAHLSTSHAEFVHNFQGLMNRCSCRGSALLIHTIHRPYYGDYLLSYVKSIIAIVTAGHPAYVSSPPNG